MRNIKVAVTKLFIFYRIQTKPLERDKLCSTSVVVSCDDTISLVRPGWDGKVSCQLEPGSRIQTQKLPHQGIHARILPRDGTLCCGRHKQDFCGAERKIYGMRLSTPGLPRPDMAGRCDSGGAVGVWRSAACGKWPCRDWCREEARGF